MKKNDLTLGCVTNVTPFISSACGTRETHWDKTNNINCHFHQRNRFASLDPMRFFACQRGVFESRDWPCSPQKGYHFGFATLHWKMFLSSLRFQHSGWSTRLGHLHFQRNVLIWSSREARSCRIETAYWLCSQSAHAQCSVCWVWL